VLSNKEKREGSVVRDPFIERVDHLISDWDLVDIVHKREKFTWSNYRVGSRHIAARLDRFLIHSDFFLENISISWHVVASRDSDHKAISLVFEEHDDLGSIPFHFNHLQLEDVKYIDIIKEMKIRIVKYELKV
jgi:hypothetical protein